MFGTALLIAGLLWQAAIAKGFTEVSPAVLDKPWTALAVAILGFTLLRLGRRIEAEERASIESAVAGDEAQTARFGMKPKDFRDMLQELSASALSARQSEPAPKPAPEAARVAKPVEPETVPEDEEAEDADAPTRVVMAALARIQAEARNPALMAVGHTRFRAVPGQVAGRSWIGGLPSLPHGVDWPRLAGSPAAFLAQIDLSELQPEIWGGQGPRTGWLSVFVGGPRLGRIAVLHNRLQGRLRPLPKGAPDLFPERAPEWRLSALVGPEALIAPRWSLEAMRDDGDAEPVAAPAAFLEDGRLDEPALYPFDWVSALALLDSLSLMLRRLLKKWEADVAPTLASDAASAAREARMMTLARLRLLSRQTEARAEGAPFDEDEAEVLMSRLAELTTEGWDAGRPARLLLSLPLFRAYKPLVELHARRVLAQDPEALPRIPRRALLPHWQALAAQPALTMGGEAPAGQVALLTVRGGGLTGWQLGPRNVLTVTLPQDALERGDFSAARVAQPRSTSTEPTE
ncbi:DUF1963 domain-containing protein [Thetidibacter halocola]|uniref:DUF1963 domain-containing protein n=1 Tax=Thetidibacter halocola TaxID=2827239 RepID=A0A8J8B8I9_9RHOB|nr:DUF1963 domain-containing protein [Thetidibacter halocola]MBS0124804.1 DUF1963 domain-containing protein [Thetidibacter halocola]